MENETRQRPHIMELIANAPWREAVTYRDSRPHEYVVVRKDGQEELLAAFCERIERGEGVGGYREAGAKPSVTMTASSSHGSDRSHSKQLCDPSRSSH